MYNSAFPDTFQKVSTTACKLDAPPLPPCHALTHNALQNLVAFEAFFDAMNELAQARSGKSLRGHASTKAIEAKWSAALPVYAQVCHRNHVRAVVVPAYWCS